MALPGELAADSELSVTQFLSNMQRVLDNPLLPVTGTRHNTAASRAAPTELPAALLTAPYVLVRRDGHVPPLELLYDGPYAVLRRCPQYFTIQLGDREEVVSTSRLKPCQSPVTVAAQPRTRGRPRGSGTRSGLPPRRLPGPAQTPPAQPEPGGEDTPVPANPPQPPRRGGLGRHYVARGPPAVSSPLSWSPPSVDPLHWGWRAGQGYLPVGLPALPAHPRYFIPVGSPARMVGRLPCPLPGAGRAPLHRHGLRLQALHLPVWLHALHRLGLLLPWSTLQAAYAQASSGDLSATSPSRTTSQRPQRRQRTPGPSREPFSPARQLGFLHAPTRLLQCGLHANAVGLLI